MSADSPGSGNQSACAIDLDFTHTFLPVVFVVVFVVGLVANACGLRSVCSRWRKLGDVSIFILNLGIADLLYVSTLPFLVSYYALGSRWMFGETFCKVTRFCFNLNLYGSIGFLTCISIYRYLGIVHPMKVKGKINSRLSVVVSALVWALVIVQISPDMFFNKTAPNSSDSCYDTTADGLAAAYLPYSLGWTFTGFVVPLAIIILCYGHIAYVLTANGSINVLLKQRCLKLVVVVTVLFSICFIPFHVLRNLNLQTRIAKLRGECHHSFDDIYFAYQISRGLACTNSAINPLIYLVGNDDFLLRLHRLGREARRTLARCAGAAAYRRAHEMDSMGVA
ncbi:P2Y purinoceptor 1-like [Denticeps clupeoides]|uniref:G-protein coupled receptors family 1 profile domain-containing protein n=1 Tax=Denticeps clupeoides TaxID=299321 RepID=A0AAY4BXK0_9TELE|nr:P2Y purinoceptor 1-like [Denticeps clupeoides]